MPRITDERREARREQIIDAAIACLQEHGLEAVSMEMIIARSGLSTGAVYRYFKGKDEVMGAAVAAGMDGVSQALAPVLSNPDPPPPPEFIGQVLAAGLGFAHQDPGVDRMLVAVHGWSHLQTVSALKAASLARFQGVRERFAAVVKKWQAAGTLDPQADPQAVAELLMSITLGFIAQRALAGGADPAAHVAALAALTQAPAG